MSLKRQRYPMPDFVLAALEGEGLTEKYYARPPYQQNDYIGWITRAKRQETIDKRLNQMLEELKYGGKHLGMDYRDKV